MAHFGTGVKDHGRTTCAGLFRLRAQRLVERRGERLEAVGLEDHRPAAGAGVGEFAQNLLREIGHEVEWVHSGEVALERARRQDFDAVFSDVVMPGMSGLELAEALKVSHPDLPVILTTGYSDKIAAGGAGGRPVILKPYRLETLSAALDLALGSERRQR